MYGIANVFERRKFLPAGHMTTHGRGDSAGTRDEKDGEKISHRFLTCLLAGVFAKKNIFKSFWSLFSLYHSQIKASRKHNESREMSVKIICFLFAAMVARKVSDYLVL
jgi:hypothetical protein